MLARFGVFEWSMVAVVVRGSLRELLLSLSIFKSMRA